ncbi:hypothetical protein [Paenibacillus alvei]|uniref:Aldose 1-epimerase n=1 Tax=Paenibacillus alvei TaxID=44250 RepID=A0A383R6X8_PAEAL|nr:hypothetical protein [Paenibacillus alvei]SYX82332.1 conserved protein of unknown function [Paenibacillus alvei]
MRTEGETIVAAVQMNTIQHERWGESLHLENGTYEVIVPLTFGIRIMHFSLCGQENMLFEDREEAIRQEGEAFHALGSDGWLLRGGHRLWASPEAYPRTYTPDDRPIEYVQTESGVRLIAPVEPWTQCAKEIELIFQQDDVVVIHRIANKGAWPIQLAPWAITVMAPGGTAVVPQITRDTGLLPNRSISLWPYAAMNDERVTWGERHIEVKQVAHLKQAFKFGMLQEEGKASYTRNGIVFEKRYEPISGASYPDGGCSFELYTNEHILELESLGSLVTLEPESVATHQEVWSLAPIKDV